MQTAKNAAASAKEAATNVGASAVSGLEKTKATVQGGVEKMTAHHPAEKVAAEQKKQERIVEAEIRKQEVMEQNAVSRAGGLSGVGPVGVTTAHNYTPGTHVGTTGAVGTHPTATAAAAAARPVADDPLAGPAMDVQRKR